VEIICQRVILVESETDKLVGNFNFDAFMLPYIERILQIFNLGPEHFETELKTAIISLAGNLYTTLTKLYSTGQQGAMKFLYSNTEYLLQALLGIDCLSFIKTHVEHCIEKSVDHLIESFNYMKSKEQQPCSLTIVRVFLFILESH
jgi:hypothetical protein